ncbi:serine hydrolase [Rossellomorea marisflavi]|uniref:serine hydrolase n=1 Tax=Rossellomorea marisflavi TaxID=189381 RepID=UPI003D2D4DF0
MEYLREEMMGIVQECSGKVSFSVLLDDESLSWEEDRRISSASLIKLPILLAAYEQIQTGRLQADAMIVLRHEDHVEGAGVLNGLHDGLTLSIEDLLTLMITVSDNTATNRLIELIGMDSINRFCLDWNLKGTFLSRKMMDFPSLEMGKDNWTSSEDVVSCLTLINEGPFEEASRKKMLTMLSHQQFRDKLPALLGDDVKVFNKTGELPGVEHDCAIIESASGKYAYIAVLTDELPAPEEGRRVIRTMGKLIGDYVHSF